VHGEVEAVTTAAGLRVTVRGSMVAADAVGCGIWTIGLQPRRWGGHQRLQSESEVGREPSFATIGGGTTNSVVARQWDILRPGGGSDLKSGGVVTSLGGCGAMTLRAMVRSPWHRGLGKKIFYHDLRSTNLALQQRGTRSEVATGRA
jgi:hypothetical protein